MNLSQVATPAELLELNNTATEPNTTQLEALVEQLDLDETYELALKLVQNLGNYHQHVINELKEQNELDRLVVWSADEQKLHTCWDLLSEVSTND